MLLEIGRWLKINGEAIYGSRPWKIFGEGPTQVVEGSFADTKRKAFTGQDIRFTTKERRLYAIDLAWPENAKLVVKSLAQIHGQKQGNVKSVRLLGHSGKLDWKQSTEGLVVTLPARRPCEHAFAFEITGEGLTPVRP
jgi:alpha-L-fucosidase